MSEFCLQPDVYRTGECRNLLAIVEKESGLYQMIGLKLYCTFIYQQEQNLKDCQLNKAPTQLFSL